MQAARREDQLPHFPISPETDLLGSDVRNPKDSAPRSRRVYEQRYVRSLFDSIASRYDLLNHVLSYGFDYLWRRKVVKLLASYRPRTILDLATGTADLAIAEARLPLEHVVGVDLSKEMLRVAAEKVRKYHLQELISLEEGVAEHLRFDDNSFDAVTVAFGVRNFTDLARGLSEMHRVVRPGGVILVLEFSEPTVSPLRLLYHLYLHHVLPLVGGLISRNREAYRYLPRTVGEFPSGELFTSLLTETGFTQTRSYPLTFGIATIYEGHKQPQITR